MIRRLRNLSIVISFAGAVLAYGACSNVSVNAESDCTAGATQACVCGGGTPNSGQSAKQTCWADGTFGACECGQTYVGTPFETSVPGETGVPDAVAAETTAPDTFVDESAVDAGTDTATSSDDAGDDASTSDTASNDAAPSETGS